MFGKISWSIGVCFWRQFRRRKLSVAFSDLKIIYQESIRRGSFLLLLFPCDSMDSLSKKKVVSIVAILVSVNVLAIVLVSRRLVKYTN
jgi:hypothetical protein